MSAAVALEVIRLYEEGGIIENGKRSGRRFMERLEGLLSHPLVGDARGRGLVGAVELVIDKKTREPFPAEAGVGALLSQLTWDNGVIVRCFAHGVIGFAPALCCTEDEVDEMVDRVERSLDQMLRMPEIRSLMR